MPLIGTVAVLEVPLALAGVGRRSVLHLWGNQFYIFND